MQQRLVFRCGSLAKLMLTILAGVAAWDCGHLGTLWPTSSVSLQAAIIRRPSSRWRLIGSGMGICGRMDRLGLWTVATRPGANIRKAGAMPAIVRRRSARRVR
jgi:hypothetical protein